MLFACLLAQADPAALVERLGAEDIEVRQRAEAELALLGPEAEAALDAAARGGDPEAAGRARRLLLDVVAPHRREVAALVRHMARHARSDPGGPSRSILLDLLRLIDPTHPALSEPDPWRDEERLVGSLRPPSGEAWSKYRGGLKKLVRVVGDRTPCPDCARDKLSDTRVDLTFEHATANEVLKLLEDLSGLEIVLDAGLAETVDFSRAARVLAKGETLEGILKDFLPQYGLEHRITDEGVVLLTRSGR